MIILIIMKIIFKFIIVIVKNCNRYIGHGWVKLAPRNENWGFSETVWLWIVWCRLQLVTKRLLHFEIGLQSIGHSRGANFMNIQFFGFRVTIINIEASADCRWCAYFKKLINLHHTTYPSYLFFIYFYLYFLYLLINYSKCLIWVF